MSERDMKHWMRDLITISDKELNERIEALKQTLLEAEREANAARIVLTMVHIEKERRAKL